MSEILLPTWIKPQAETSTLIDDSTSVFRAAYAPGLAQRVSYVEPRLQVKQSFKGLRGFERAAMLGFLNRTKGKFATVRAAVGYTLRGSFPVTELFTNNDYSGASLTAWQFDSSKYSRASVDNVYRAVRLANMSFGFPAYQTGLQYTTYLPFVTRNFSAASNPNDTLFAMAGGGDFLGQSSGNTGGYAQVAYVPTSAPGADTAGLQNGSVDGQTGDFIDVYWQSFAQCALVDNSANAADHSDDFSTAAWTKSGTTIAANGAVAPDGTTTMDALIENSSNSTHFMTQSVVRTSQSEDRCGYICAVRGTGNNRDLQITVDDAAGNGANAIFNLGAGTVTSTGLIGGGANARAFIKSMGNGRYFCYLIVTVPATTVGRVEFFLVSSGATTYTGNGTSSIFLWRAGNCASAVPLLPGATGTSGAPVGTSQTGNTLRLKGLPPSTQGLLLTGDSVQIGGELKLLTHRLDSDVAGLGMMKFGPAMCRSPADNDPVVISQPLGKFILADNASWTNDYGVYADVDITLEAINE